MSVRLPRLLDAQLHEVCRLHPVTLSINERLVPPHDASMTLPPGEGVSFHAWMELYTIDGSAGFYRVSGTSESYVSTGDVDLEHSAAILGDAIIPGEGKYSGTCTEVLTAMLANQTTLINGQKPWVLGTCAKSASIEYAYDCNNILSAMTEVVGDEKDGYALEFDDTHGFPWKVNVVSVETSASCEGRLSRNLESASVSMSDDEFCTRIYCKSLPEPHYIDGPTVGTWGIITKTITAGEGVTAESLQSYITRYLEDHKNPRNSIEINGVDLATATGENLDSFRVGRLFRLALPDYGVKMEERILVRSITDVYGDPRGVRLTLASNIRDTAEDLVRIDNTVTGGSSQNSTRKYVGSKGTGLSKTSVLDMLKKTDSFTSATEAWVKEAGVKIEANRASLYATKTAITGSWNENVENIDALITATTDNGGLVAMIVGRKTKTEEINAAIKATTEGGGLITLKADTKTVSDLGERVSTAEISIDGLNSEIELKADKITLKGYVTADQLSAELADFKLTMNESVVTNFLSVNNKAIFNSMILDTKPISLESLNVATGRSTETAVYVSKIILNSDGTVKSVKGDSKTFVTGLSYSTIQYLKWS
jgi:hypothetical protein